MPENERVITMMQSQHPELIQDLKSSVSTLIEANSVLGGSPSNKSIIKTLESDDNYKLLILRLQIAGFELSRRLVGRIRSTLDGKKPGY